VASLPERRGDDGVGRLHLLPLRRHAAEVAVLQRRVEAALQRRVDVGQSHQVLGFLRTERLKHNIKTYMLFIRKYERISCVVFIVKCIPVIMIYLLL